MSTTSYFEHHVFVCKNQRKPGHIRGCCASKNAEKLHLYFKDRIKALRLAGKSKTRINQAGCLDRCELGVVIVIYPNECWYSVKNESDIDAIIDSHIIKGIPVESLRLKKNQK